MESNKQDESIKQLLEALKPKPPTWSDILQTLVYYSFRTIYFGLLIGLGLRLAGVGM